jgi:hypothetical protein
MSCPYCEGKHGTDGSGGHTSIGIHIPEGSTRPATSNENTRIGNLDTRTIGVGRDKRHP